MNVDDSLACNSPRRSATNNVQPQCSDVVVAAVAAYGLQENSGHFGVVVKRLLARGFVVVKQHHSRGNRNETGEAERVAAVRGPPDAAVGGPPDAAVGGPPAGGDDHVGDDDHMDDGDDDHVDDGDDVDDENDDEVSSVCGQLECLSVMEGGVVYGVRVADRRDAARARSVTALAAAGAHPNIVSYFSNWTDSLYRYVQLEFCPENLSSVSDQLERGADFRAVLEHVACALHYLHRVKRYAHNRVNRWNIYRTNVDSDGAVYKLGGFLAATRLRQPADDPAAFADVQSLCTTVLRLMRRRDNGPDADEDVRELRDYLLSATGGVDDPTFNDNVVDAAANPAPDGRVNALSVWRWCCSTRQRQQQQREERPYSLMAMVFGNSFFGGQMDFV